MKSEIIAVVSVGVVATGIIGGLIGAIWSDVGSDISYVRDEIAAMRSDVADNSERLVRVEGKLEEQSRRLAEIKSTIGAHEARFDQIEQTLVFHGSTLNNIVKVIALAGWGDEGVAIVENTGDKSAPGYEVEAQVIEPEEDAAIVVAEVAVSEVAVIESEAPPLEVAEAPTPEPSYTVITEKDSSFGNARRRVTLEIEIVGADPAARTTIETMMQVAIRRHQVDQPDAVSVRLWRSYEDDSNAQNRLIYAPDGCGWSGDDCAGESWTELLKGDLPNG